MARYILLNIMQYLAFKMMVLLSGGQGKMLPSVITVVPVLEMESLIMPVELQLEKMEIYLWLSLAINVFRS